MTLQPHWSALPWTDQNGFDEMLWACDLNFVRGEDSLVRALWAGQPFVWHIYPQDDKAHHAKLDAFLDWLQAPDSLRRFHRVWNGMTEGELHALDSASTLNWHQCIRSAQQTLWMQNDLVSNLVSIATQHRDKI